MKITARRVFFLLFTAAGLWPLASGLYTSELRSNVGLVVMGTSGSGSNPDVSMLGFTVFGSTQSAYPGPVQSGDGSVVVNGYLSVSSGAYFVGGSTFSAGGAYFTGVSSFSDAGSIYIGGTGATTGSVLTEQAASGQLQWTIPLMDNLGNHIATQDFQLGSNWLSGNGSSAGVFFDGSGNVGVGTAGPGALLDVQGGGVANFGNSLTVGGVTYASVPSGMIDYFYLDNCPTGWTEYTTAQGRYVVGLVGAASPGTLIGTLLGVAENRPTGQHNHGFNDATHAHAYYKGSTSTNATGIYANTSNTVKKGGPFYPAIVSATSGVTLNKSGSTDGSSGTAGTNAPYMQLLMCQKQ